MSLQKAELLPEDERKMLKGSYSHRDFMAEVGTGSIMWVTSQPVLDINTNY